MVFLAERLSLSGGLISKIRAGLPIQELVSVLQTHPIRSLAKLIIVSQIILQAFRFVSELSKTMEQPVS
jgi:hypothetical protein